MEDAIKIKTTLIVSYLGRWRQHPLYGHSCAFPLHSTVHCCTAASDSHFQDSWNSWGRWVPHPDQRMPHWLSGLLLHRQWDNPAADTPLEHCSPSSCHHTPYPTCYESIPPLFLHSPLNHSLAGDHHFHMTWSHLMELCKTKLKTFSNYTAIILFYIL